MGLDVGVVPPIRYLGQLDEEVHAFIWHLDFNLDDSDWYATSDTNTFVEYTRESMTRQIEQYIADKNPTGDAAQAIRSWVSDLPWRDDEITLHFRW